MKQRAWSLKRSIRLTSKKKTDKNVNSENKTEDISIIIVVIKN